MARPTALVYSPSLHVLGGGERYLFGLATALQTEWDVTVGGIIVPPVDELVQRGFPTELPTVEFRIHDLPVVSAGYDLACFFAIYPPSYPNRAARSVLEVMFPFRSAVSWRHPRAAWRERRALRSYHTVLSTSEYTRAWVERRWRLPSEVLYPPVSLGSYDESRKEPLILSIARFIPPKGHATLLDAYLALPAEVAGEWKLVLVGGATDRPYEQQHLERLRARGAGNNIEILPNAPEAEVRDLLAAASLFWHGAGAERSPQHPEDAEHFGISIVEAMSYGAVPLVYDDGGVGEFVDAGNGVRWASVEELAAASERLVGDPGARRSLARQATQDARRFGTEQFASEVRRRFPPARA
jgi:glycosyltransferase involved in cell wall biosynthesis